MRYYKTNLTLCLALLVFSSATFSSEKQTILAFPGAEGFGAYAKGGRGGQVYTVTNLEDSGPGSFRWAVEQEGPRTIVFAISGTISLKENITIRNPFITIAGQTAPGDGICLRAYCFKIQADHIIVRFIRSRLGHVEGGTGDTDAISITDGNNIIVDHCTASWSVDETLSCQSATVDMLTVQWCMVTESLNKSRHSKGAHGLGGIVGSLRQSYHHNLFAHHTARNPKVTWRRYCKVDFRNNVIYNWKNNSCHDGSVAHMNWANNYYKYGPATSMSVRDRIFQLDDKNDAPEASTYECQMYAEGNYVWGYPSVTADNWSGGIDFRTGTSEAKNRVYSPFNYPAIREQSALDAYDLVLPSVGASLVRDAIDKRIINEVITRTTTYGSNGIIDSQTDVGGWPVYKTYDVPTDTDQDGMPDVWETDKGLNPSDPNDRNGDPDGDGYTNLEEYLNGLVATAWDGDATNFSFADGHSDYWKWRDPRTVDIAEMTNPQASDSIQPGNPDLRAVQKAA